MKQYLVLLITAFGKESSNGWYYKEGFEKNGHAVITFDPSMVPDPEMKILNLVNKRHPDIVLHTKNELPLEVFHKLRQQTKIVQWYPDPVIPEWLPDYVRCSDIFFTMTEGLIEEFTKFNQHVFWLSQAYSPSRFQIKSISEEDRRKFSAQISFVGNLGSKERYLTRRKYLQAVLKNGFHLKWWGPRLPRKLSTIPLLMGKLGRAYGGGFARAKAHTKVARLSDICLGFDSMPHLRKSMSERMYITIGCGGFYMCLHVEGIEDVLVPDKEIVTFRTEDEMIDKVKYYLTNGKERRRIAEAGQKRVLEEHTYGVRIGQMLETINKIL